MRRVVSGSLGASLWILQQLFTDAALGIRGTDLHIENFDEAPFGTGFAVTRAGSRVSAGWAGPLYYALLAFAQAAGRHGRLLQSSFWTRAPKHRNVHLYEVLQPDGSLRIVVINEDLNHSGRVRILSPGSRGAGSLVRLIGLLRRPHPSADVVKLPQPNLRH